MKYISEKANGVEIGSIRIPLYLNEVKKYFDNYWILKGCEDIETKIEYKNFLLTKFDNFQNKGKELINKYHDGNEEYNSELNEFIEIIKEEVEKWEIEPVPEVPLVRL